MNVELRPTRAQKTRYGIVDCDIHPKMLIEDYRKYLSNQWWSYLHTYGVRPRHGFTKSYPMPKIAPHSTCDDYLRFGFECGKANQLLAAQDPQTSLCIEADAAWIRD